VAHPRRVVSGGQTGVDRAALDAAIAAGIPHGGWCPRGRRAEDGVVPVRYRLREHASARYAARTAANVLDADATLVLRRGPSAGGTALTERLARRHGKPVLVVDLAGDPDVGTVRRWLDARRVRVLNVAGPRESQRPGIGREAARFLARVLAGRVRCGSRRRADPRGRDGS
jgi:hypothetical protein